MRAMKISNAFTQNNQPISFEIFPPKGELSLETARTMAADLAALKPDFISVTFSAGGSGNSGATVEIARMIQEEYGIPTMAHLACIGLTKDHLATHIATMKEYGIANVLALRGDRVAGADPVYDFSFAKDIIPALVDAGFCVGAAAYPEGHITCTDFELSVEHLKEKQDAGASFFVSQLFFDNEYYFRFLDMCEKKGISIPITPGIMPFLSKAQIQRMVFMCGASLPSPIIKLLAKYEDDPDALRAAGIEYACEQLVGLQSAGVDGLHVYTMNQPDIARSAVEALRAARAAV